ncbi:hypothetical protein ACQ7HM_10380 [Williamsia sp. MIQD14]|uniref:hypothetical protein n=1 Tax=Williamsia sp. MIQD14 TaxID=3425703 RepID=UPI003DA075C8
MPDDAVNDAQTNSPTPPRGAKEKRTGDRTTFWLSSIAWGTVLLIVGVFGTLIGTFLYGEIQAGDHSFDTSFTAIASAIFWTILGVIGTCYFSIPLATLAVALIRFIARLIRRGVRRKRSQLQS